MTVTRKAGGPSGRRRAALGLAAAVALVLSAGPTATAQEIDDVVDLTCGPWVSGPFAGPNDHSVTASGGYSCSTRRPSIGVVVCLHYNGAPVRCEQDVKMNASDASADVNFPCLPGVWTVTAIGVATGGPPGAAAGVAIPLDCDPL
ncbi:MAG TPA: hypothetical protein VHN37_06180 [Actinomycetota bacterium]|nr:hypothetical protein [Actinomycetota bacterium]